MDTKSIPIEVMKAYFDGTDTYIEGWVSTPDRDLDNHSSPPECFVTSLPEYFQRNAPISDTHDMTPHPKGHHQRGALIREGAIFLECEHPTDPAPFKHLPQSGSGWWGRARVTDWGTAGEIRKGNLAGFSWTGKVTDYDTNSDGSLTYKTVYPLRESCVAAYPRNTKASFITSKAEKGQHSQMDEEQLEKVMLSILAKRDAEQAAVAKQGEFDAVKAENAELRTLIGALTTQVTSLGEEVQKALLPQRGAGTGSQTQVETDEEKYEKDPIGFVVSKASEKDKLTPHQKQLVAEMSKQVWMQGLTSDKE